MMKARERNFDFIRKLGFDYTEDVSAARLYCGRKHQYPIAAVCEILYYNVDDQIWSARFVWICNSIADIDVFQVHRDNLRRFMRAIICFDAILDEQSYFVYDGGAYRDLVKTEISVPSVFTEIDMKHIVNLREYLLP